MIGNTRLEGGANKGDGMVNGVDILKSFTAAIKAGHIEEAGRYLSDDFEFRGPAGEQLDRDGFLRLLRAQKSSYPGWALHLRCFQILMDRVVARARFLGQPSSLLLVAVSGDASYRSAASYRDVGEFIAAPEEQHEYRFKGDQIASLLVRGSRTRINSKFSAN